MRTSASFTGLKPASERATKAAQGSSQKSDTKCELLLRRRLWQLGCRYRVDVSSLPGRPDIVFPKARLVVFCDGDFWHGRKWTERQRKLHAGHNADYWLKKIGRNIERDRQNTDALESDGWTVLRFWEGDILKRCDDVVAKILTILDARGHRQIALSGSGMPCGISGSPLDGREEAFAGEQPSAAVVPEFP